jgi:hypothetical protein
MTTQDQQERHTSPRLVFSLSYFFPSLTSSPKKKKEKKRKIFDSNSKDEENDLFNNSILLISPLWPPTATHLPFKLTIKSLSKSSTPFHLLVHILSQVHRKYV